MRRTTIDYRNLVRYYAVYVYITIQTCASYWPVHGSRSTRIKCAAVISPSERARGGTRVGGGLCSIEETLLSDVSPRNASAFDAKRFEGLRRGPGDARDLMVTISFSTAQPGRLSPLAKYGRNRKNALKPDQ